MRSLPQLSIMQVELDYNMSQIPCSVFCSISTNELIDNVCLASPLRLLFKGYLGFFIEITCHFRIFSFKKYYLIYNIGATIPILSFFRGLKISESRYYRRVDIYINGQS